MDALPARTAPCLPALGAEGNARPLAAALAALLALLRILLGPAAHQTFRALLATPAFLPRLRAALAAGADPTATLWSRRTLSPAQRRRAHARLAVLRTKHHVALPARTRRPGPAAIQRAIARLRALAHGIWLALPPYPPVSRRPHPVRVSRLRRLPPHVSKKPACAAGPNAASSMQRYKITLLTPGNPALTAPYSRRPLPSPAPS